MSNVLVLAGIAPLVSTLTDAVADLHAAGATVWLAGMTPVSRTLEDVGLDNVRALHLEAESHGSEFWRQNWMADPPQRMWLHVRHDAWTLRRAAEADVLVALDNQAVLAVWQLSRRHPAAAARLGLAPARAAVAARPAPRMTAQPADPSEPTTASARGQAAGRLLAAAPAPLRGRLLNAKRLDAAARSRLGLAAVQAALDSGRPDRARSAASTVTSTLGTHKERADFLGEVVARDLEAGRDVALLREAYQAELDYADSLLSREAKGRAAASFMQATRLAFHRSAHMDTVSSPLADDPSGFLERLHDSPVFSALTRPAGRTVPAMPRAGERRNVLLATTNDSFLDEIRSQLGSLDHVDLRVVDAADLKIRYWAHNAHRIVASELEGDGRARRRASVAVPPWLEWADVLFVDWCTPMAYHLSMADPGDTRVVVRLHSFEAFTLWPQLVDWSRVDDLVFVSDHLRDLTLAAVPRLRNGGTTTHVIPNAVDLKRFVLPKPASARFDVGLVGYSVVAKDPRWAVEVIKLLRAQDERYRLVLAGHDLYAGPTAAARNYAERFAAELAELAETGAVVRLGHTDVVQALREVGVILSSSVRESQHLGLIEGAASGAVPVVRDWPYFASVGGGARRMFPADWVVTDPAGAAARILAATRDEATWRELGGAASGHAVKTWDISAHEADYRRLLAT